MKAAELARRAGVSRQWLSKLAQCGIVPDAVRLASGRWDYKNTPALRSWIKQAQAATAADKRRALTKHTREAIRLRSQLAQPQMTSFKAKEVRARLDELAARPGPWNVWDVAEHTGWSVRSIQRMAKDIPDAIFEKGHFQFARTAQLAEWLDVQKGRFQARMRGMRLAKHSTLRAADLEHLRHVRALTDSLSWQMRAAFFSEKAKRPLQEWEAEELQHLLNAVELNTRPICRELRAELSRRSVNLDAPESGIFALLDAATE